MLRILGLFFGIPILLIGISWIAISMGGEIENALNIDPNFRPIRTFPVMTICGALCVWLGFRLLFTKPVKRFAPSLKRQKFQTERGRAGGSADLTRSLRPSR